MTSNYASEEHPRYCVENVPSVQGMDSGGHLEVRVIWVKDDGTDQGG